MNLLEIKEFLRNRPGYIKEGGKRLRDHLRNKGFETTIKDCKEALKQCRQENTQIINKVKTKTAKVLIYDLETSPNIGWFWRAGYKQNIMPNQITKERAIICVSYKWQGEDEVYNLTWDKNQCDKFLIEQFVEVLNEADLIVAHNGDNFDLKWLKTRALFHRIPMLPNYKQFDTLKLAKTKLYLNSNRLDYISKFLGFEGKIQTTPDLWNKVVMLNDRNAMKDMLDYCDEDVRQLEKVYNELQYLDNPRVHTGVLNGEVKYSSPISGNYNLELVKSITTNTGTIKRIMKDLDNDRIFEMSNTNYLKYKLNK
jgi:predicted PolB exonuclease-like 3'-5' exonuclease